jgi:P27 family predicted phage terminase small subunit
MPGPKPKPTHLKIIEGNRGHRKLNRNEPIPEGDLRDAPSWLTTEQRAGYRYAVRHAPAGLLKKLDRSVLIVWVVAQSLHRNATEQVEKFGLVIKSPVKGEPMQNPFLSIINRQAVIMLRAADHLGFTPASRSKIQLMDSASGTTKTKRGKAADPFFN